MNQQMRQQLTSKRIAADLGMNEKLVAANLRAPPVGFTARRLPEEPTERLRMEAASSWELVPWRSWDPGALKRMVQQQPVDALDDVLRTQGSAAEIALAANALLEESSTYSMERAGMYHRERQIREEALAPYWSSPEPGYRNGPLSLVALISSLIGGMLALFSAWMITRRQPLIVRIERHRILVGDQVVLVEDCLPDPGTFENGEFFVPLRDGTHVTVPASHALSDPDRAALMDALRIALRPVDSKEDPDARRAMQALRVGARDV